MVQPYSKCVAIMHVILDLYRIISMWLCHTLVVSQCVTSIHVIRHEYRTHVCDTICQEVRKNMPLKTTDRTTKDAYIFFDFEI